MKRIFWPVLFFVTCLSASMMAEPCGNIVPYNTYCGCNGQMKQTRITDKSGHGSRRTRLDAFFCDTGQTCGVIGVQPCLGGSAAQGKTSASTKTYLRGKAVAVTSKSAIDELPLPQNSINENASSL